MSDKKTKAKKIRKVWAIKPGIRVKLSRRRELLEKEKSKDMSRYSR